jgi:maltoporin
MSIRNAARFAIGAAAALAGASASAFEFHGYFRDSEGFNSKGGTQVCFQLPGSDFKARLGNECDRYLEMIFAETARVGETEWKFEFMPAAYQPNSSSGAGNSLFLQQAWAGLKPDALSGAMIWAGRRYFRRHDVHSLDWFYWNPGQGNAAVGIEDIDIGFGKVAVSVFRMDATKSTAVLNLTRGTYAVPEARLYGMPVNPNGTLEVGVDVAFAVDQQSAIGAGRALASPLFTVQHNQKNLLGAAGSNALTVQYGMGALANESGDGAGQLLAAGTKDDGQWRVIEQLVYNPTPELSGALVLVYQNKWTAGTVSNGASIFTGELRPAFHFNDWFKFAVDAFFQTLAVRNAPEGLGAATLFKLTAAPTFVVGREYWSRPEIRLFATWATWNANAVTLAGSDGMASGVFGTAKSGATFGASVELWF